MPLNYLYNVVYGSVWWDFSAVVTSCVTTWVLVITPVEHAAAEVLRKHGGAMRVSVFYNELYRACPEAKEEVTAKGGPKKWASSSCVHTASVSGQMISIAPTPPQPKKRQPVIHKVVLYKPQSSVKLGITLTSSNDGAVRITGINAGGIAATVPLLQVDQYVIAINGEEVRDHSSATSLDIEQGTLQHVPAQCQEGLPLLVCFVLQDQRHQGEKGMRHRHREIPQHVTVSVSAECFYVHLKKKIVSYSFYA